jgi:hypothetical protein
LVREPEGNRPLGRSTHRWENKIKLDLREIGCEFVEWLQLAENRDQWLALVKTVMNLQVP